jgi:hypothetical protein
MSSSHEVVFYTDGRHSSVYIYEPPMTRRTYTRPIDELVDLGIDTITYAVGDCRVLLYDTKAGERWGHNVDKANHLIWYRAGLNVEQFITQGLDPLAEVCERAHELGFQFLPSLIMGMQHQERVEATDCRCSDFCFDHPEYQVGPEPDFPESKWDDPTRFTYAIPEVRENRLAVIEELVSSYPTDGIELNIYDYAPFLARREIKEQTGVFTDFLRDVRKRCDAAADSQGRPKRLIVRAASSLGGCKAMGIDLETLIREEIVHGVLAMPPHKLEPMEQHPGGVAELAAAAKNVDVKIIKGVSSNIVHDNYPQATREMQTAQASNGYRVGADGVFFSTYYPSGNYPYSDSDFENIRYAGRPELLEHKDKHYAVRQGPNGPDDTPGDYQSPNPLPINLVLGRPGAEQTLYVGDDIADKKRLGEVAVCELRIRIRSMMHDDVFDLFFNGQKIPREHQEWIDWTYSVRNVPGQRLMTHYWILTDLLRLGPLPIQGDNTIRVDLTRHDERSVAPVVLHDVELVVEYRDHRHAPRRSEGWFDPRQAWG